jgi:hypothetical protein
MKAFTVRSRGSTRGFAKRKNCFYARYFEIVNNSWSIDRQVIKIDTVVTSCSDWMGWRLIRNSGSNADGTLSFADHWAMAPVLSSILHTALKVDQTRSLIFCDFFRSLIFCLRQMPRLSIKDNSEIKSVRVAGPGLQLWPLFGTLDKRVVYLVEFEKIFSVLNGIEKEKSEISNSCEHGRGALFMRFCLKNANHRTDASTLNMAVLHGFSIFSLYFLRDYCTHSGMGPEWHGHHLVFNRSNRIGDKLTWVAFWASERLSKVQPGWCLR